MKHQKIKNENRVLKWLFGRVPSKPTQKLKMNDTVNVSWYRGMFDKGYCTNWSQEYFCITKIEHTVPLVYKLSDMKDELFTGMLYGYKLQIMMIDPNALHIIEKILEKRGFINNSETYSLVSDKPAQSNYKH